MNESVNALSFVLEMVLELILLMLYVGLKEEPTVALSWFVLSFALVLFVCCRPTTSGL